MVWSRLGGTGVGVQLFLCTGADVRILMLMYWCTGAGVQAVTCC